MNNQSYSTSMTVDKSPKEVFNAINNVRGWWSENIEGDTDKAGSEWLYHYKDVHTCKIKVTELMPEKRIEWLVLENDFSFTQDKSEWRGNKMIFEIAEKGDKTQLTFTQVGLVPAYECYNVCNDAWTGFITKSLYDLIVAGKGGPTPKDKDGLFNEELITKWKLNDHKPQDGYVFSFESSKSPEAIFKVLLDVRAWWVGLYNEQIEGSSNKLNEEFSFQAGGGMHYTKQKLVELEPNRKIVWLVTDSNLSFLQDPHEWTGTKIGFEVSQGWNKSKVTFFHQGLVRSIECYNQCTSAWAQYLDNLALQLE